MKPSHSPVVLTGTVIKISFRTESRIYANSHSTSLPFLPVKFTALSPSPCLTVSQTKPISVTNYFLLDLAPVVQRADNFIQRISHYPAVQMYSKQRFWKVFHITPCASTLYTNYRAIGEFLHTFICRIATYPVDKIIRSLNNQNQVGRTVI